MTYINFNGKVIDKAKANLNFQDRGFRFGDGVFETILVNNSKLYQLELHFDRLFSGLKALKINPEYTRKSLAESCAQIISKNKLKNGFLRIATSRGIGSKGYLPYDMIEPTLIIETITKPLINNKSYGLHISQYQKPPSDCYPSNFKTAQGLNSTLSILEAQESNCDEALILTLNNEICETSSANIFWIKNNQLYTPSLETDCIKGTIRSAIFRLYNHKITEVKATIEELKAADSLFITNCNILIMPINSLAPAGYIWNIEHSIITELKSSLNQDINNA